MDEVAVIVATYNAQDKIERCIESVASQSHPAVSLYVLDGGSDDGTVDILEAYDEDICHWESEKDGGIAHAWNKGVQRASSDWVCFLGADDYFWSAAVLEELLGNLSTDDATLVYGKVNKVTSEGDIIETLGTDARRVPREAFPSQWPIPHPGALHDRLLFERYGLFDESYDIGIDYEFFLRTYEDIVPEFRDFVAVGMEHGGVSYRADNAITKVNEEKRARRAHDFPPLPTSRYLSLLKTFARAGLRRTMGDARADRIVDHLRRIRGRQPIWHSSADSR